MRIAYQTKKIATTTIAAENQAAAGPIRSLIGVGDKNMPQIRLPIMPMKETAKACTAQRNRKRSRTEPAMAPQTPNAQNRLT